MRCNMKDMVSGTLFVTIGLFFALKAWLELRIGAAVSMGPGYFPVVLGTALVLFGIAAIYRSIGKPPDPFGNVGWRGVGLIILAVLTFGLTARGLGMVPSLLLSTLIAAFAPHGARITQAVLLAVLLTAFNVGVFVYGLRLPYALIGPWIKG